MEQYLTMAADILSSADIYIIAALALLGGLAAVAKLTKTKKDDEAISKATSFLNKILGFLGKNKKEEVK